MLQNQIKKRSKDQVPDRNKINTWKWNKLIYIKLNKRMEEQHYETYKMYKRPFL